MDRTVLKAYKFIFQHSYDFNSFVTLNISLNIFYFIYICNGSRSPVSERVSNPQSLAWGADALTRGRVTEIS